MYGTGGRIDAPHDRGHGRAQDRPGTASATALAECVSASPDTSRFQVAWTAAAPRASSKAEIGMDPVYRAVPTACPSGWSDVVSCDGERADHDRRLSQRRGARARAAAPPPTTAGAMKAVLTDERFSDPNWIYERKLDGIRCIAIRDGDNVTLLSRNDLQAERPLPRARRGARERSGASSSSIDGEVVAFEGSRDELRQARASAARSTCRSSTTCSTSCGSRATTSASSRCARASGCSATRSQFHGNVRWTQHRNRDGRGVLQGGLPQGLGGADRQARRQPVRRDALARLAQVQVRARAGAGDRRLHRAPRLARRVRRAAARLLPATGSSSTPARSAPDSTPRRSTRSARRCATLEAKDSPFADPARSRNATSPGSSRSWSRRSGSPSGPATIACATRASSACATTRTRSEVVREG